MHVPLAQDGTVSRDFHPAEPVPPLDTMIISARNFFAAHFAHFTGYTNGVYSQHRASRACTPPHSSPVNGPHFFVAQPGEVRHLLCQSLSICLSVCPCVRLSTRVTKFRASGSNDPLKQRRPFATAKIGPIIYHLSAKCKMRHIKNLRH